MHYLLEDALGCVFIQALPLLHELQEVTSVRILHHKQEVFRTLEDFKEADDVGVTDFLQNVDLLHDLLLRVRVLHVAFVDGLDGNLPPCELVYSERHLAEGTFTNRLDKLVKLKRCRR